MFLLVCNSHLHVHIAHPTERKTPTTCISYIYIYSNMPIVELKRLFITVMKQPCTTTPHLENWTGIIEILIDPFGVVSGVWPLHRFPRGPSISQPATFKTSARGRKKKHKLEDFFKPPSEMDKLMPKSQTHFSSSTKEICPALWPRFLQAATGPRMPMFSNPIYRCTVLLFNAMFPCLCTSCAV